jgi:tetratricopeptide (TPR) repeat protein
MRRLLIILSAVTCYFTVSGFDCASPEMTTAKMAIQHKEYSKAEESLTKEVTLHPANGEAWMLLGDTYFEQGRYADMRNAYEKALRDGNQPAITADQRRNVSVRLYNAWLSKYNGALDAFNKGLESKDNAAFQHALALLDTADMLRADYPENTFLRSTIYRELGDQGRERQELNKYVEALNSSIDAGVAAGISLNMTQQAVTAKLGAPTRTKVTDSTGGWAYYEPRKLWVYYAPAKSGEPRVEGWKVATAGEPEFISELPFQIRSYPEYALGVEAFRAGETDKSRYDEAQKLLQRVVRYDPDRAGVTDVLSRIYINTGRTAEAKAAIEEQMRLNPKDPTPYITYGNLLFSMNDYSGAATAFKQALGLGLPDSDEKMQIALFNLGAVYKNWGKQMQDSIEKVSKDHPSPAQVQAFQAPLREAMGYFERLKTQKVKDGDFAVLAELANIYDVLGDKAKLNSTIKEIESIQNVGDNATNVTYWVTLRRLYAITEDVDKSNAADQKVKDLGGE